MALVLAQGALATGATGLAGFLAREAVNQIFELGAYNTIGGDLWGRREDKETFSLEGADHSLVYQVMKDAKGLGLDPFNPASRTDLVALQNIDLTISTMRAEEHLYKFYKDNPDWRKLNQESHMLFADGAFSAKCRQQLASKHLTSPSADLPHFDPAGRVSCEMSCSGKDCVGTCFDYAELGFMPTKCMEMLDEAKLEVRSLIRKETEKRRYDVLKNVAGAVAGALVAIWAAFCMRE